MQLFTFETASDSPEKQTSNGPISVGEKVDIRILSRKKDVTLDVSKITKQYAERVDEIFSVINAKKSDSSGKIKVDSVTVKLGIEAGGKIGWFVEGRLDVALAFDVQFKFGE